MIRLISAMLAIVLLVGCGSATQDMTPSRQWVIASDSLNAVRDATVDLYDAGVISKDDLKALDPAEKVARKAITVAATTLPEGGQTFADWMHVFNESMKTLAEQYAAKAKGTTNGNS